MQTFMSVKLKLKEGQHINLIITHLKAKKRCANVRTDQVNKLLYFMSSHKTMSTKEPIFLIGDFNAESGENCINILEHDGWKNVYDWQKTKYPRQSATITLWDKKHNNLETLELDYIFYNSQQCSNILPVSLLVKPSLSTLLPNQDYPSDHIFLQCKFFIKSSRQ